MSVVVSVEIDTETGQLISWEPLDNSGEDRHGHGHHRSTQPRVRWSLGPVQEADLGNNYFVTRMNPSNFSGAEKDHWSFHHHHRSEREPDMSFVLQDNQQVSFAVTGTDARGNAAKLTGTPAFSVDDPSILELTDNGDGTGSVSSTGKIGSAILKVTDSEGNQEYVGSVAIDVVAGPVTAVGVVLSAPTDVNAPAADTPVVSDPVTTGGTSSSGDASAPSGDASAPAPSDPTAPSGDQPTDPGTAATGGEITDPSTGEPTTPGLPDASSGSSDAASTPDTSGSDAAAPGDSSTTSIPPGA